MIDNQLLNILPEGTNGNRFTKINIIQGFIGSNNKGETTLLGRGGSDYTASLIAKMTNSHLLEIYSDVDGVMTIDPKINKNAKTIKNLNYNQTQQLSHFGGKVIYYKTIFPLIESSKTT